MLDSCIIGLTCLPPSLRHIAYLAVELERFVSDRAIPSIIEKLRFKGVAMHAYSVSVYYTSLGNQLNVTGFAKTRHVAIVYCWFHVTWNTRNSGYYTSPGNQLNVTGSAKTRHNYRDNVLLISRHLERAEFRAGRSRDRTGCSPRSVGRTRNV